MPGTECPDRDQILTLADGRLSDSRERELLTHMEHCADCRAALNSVFHAANHIPDRQPSHSSRAILEDPAYQHAVEKIKRLDDGMLIRRSEPDKSPSSPGSYRDLTGQQIGQYEIVEHLGAGGMGVVYKARDSRLKRMVALKLIHLNRLDQDSMTRFRIEAETIARLSHPNIVQIFEVGEHDGLPYFALELVEGGNLDQYVKGELLTVRQASRTVVALARAAEYAHQHGVVHRDLKPGNVLVSSPSLANDREDSSPDDSWPSGSVPKITDFGLAKQLNNDSDLTRTGLIMGTPSYMAPEQARGEVRQVGPPTDIYSLGAILYALVTGRAPFVGESDIQTISMVIEDEPLPPSKLHPGLPRDVETICLKCLAKQPGKRYASATDLADDLERFLKSEPILARPVGSLERLAKTVKRRPALATLLGLVAALVVFGFPAITALYLNSEYHRKEAVSSDREAKQGVARLRAAQGVTAMREGKLVESLVWTSSALDQEAQIQGNSPGTLSDTQRTQQFRFEATLQRIPALVANWNVTLAQPSQEIDSRFAFSPDSQFLEIASAKRPGRWRVSAGAVTLDALETRSDVVQSVKAADGQIEANAYADYRISVLDRTANRLLHTFDISLEDLPTEPAQLARCHLGLSPDNHLLAATIPVSQRQQHGLIWDLENGELLWRGKVGSGSLIAFTNSGKVFLGGTTMWSPASDQITEWPLALENSFFQSPVSSDGRWIAYVYFHHPQQSSGPPRLPDYSVEIRDSLSGDVRVLSRRIPNAIDGFGYDSTNRWFYVEDFLGNVEIWDTTTWQSQALLQQRGNWKPTFSPDGRWIALSDHGNAVSIWDISQSMPVTSSLPHPETIRATAWAPNGRQLAVLGVGGSVRVWDLSRQNQPSRTLIHDSPINVVRFSRDDRQLATGAADATAQVWDLVSGKPVGTPLEHEESVVALSWDSTGTQLATVNGRNRHGSHGNAVQVWRPSDGTAVTPALGREIGSGYGVGRAMFSPVNNHLLIQYLGDANIFDLNQRQDIGVIKHPGPGSAMFGELHYSGDGRRLFTVKGAATVSVCVWQMPDGRLQTCYEIEGVPDGIKVNDIALSQDGRYFAMANSSGILVLEVPGDPSELRTLFNTRTKNPVRLTCFNRSDDQVLAVGISGTCQVWDLQSSSPLGASWEIGGRPLFASFGPNDEWIVTVLGTGEVQLWDPRTGQPLCPPRQHGSRVHDAALSRSGLQLATAGVDGAVRIWDLRTEYSHHQTRSRNSPGCCPVKNCRVIHSFQWTGKNC